MKNIVIKSILIIIALLLIGGGIYVTLRDRGDTLPPVPAVIGEAFDLGDFDKAIELSNELLASEPNNIYAILFLSQIYAQKGSLEFKEQEFGQKALEYANRALALTPDDSKVYIAIGYANEIMQKYDAAFAAYSKAIDLAPRSAEGYIRLGHAYDLSGDIVKARENYLKAASIDPTNPQVAQNLGRLYVRSGEVDKAIEQFSFVASNSQNTRLKAEAYYNLSTMAFYSNSTDNLIESIAYASTSISIDPEYSLAYLALGRAYVTQKDFEKAAPMLDKAISLYPDLSSVYEWQARMSYLKNDKKTAISLYDAQKKAALLDIGLMDSERSKSVSDAAFNQAFIFTELNQKAEAISALNESVENANPITLLIIKFTLDGASKNELKSLTSEQSFKDLLVKVNEKVQAEEERLKENNPVSILERVKNAANSLKIKKALAETRSCGEYNGAQVTYPFDAGHWTANASAIWFCESIIKYLNGERIPLALLTYYANAIDPNAAGVITNNYNGISGAVYLGCANGVGATYIPVKRTLTVTKSGTGAGTVAGTGISCGADCSEDYYQSTVVSLSASPSNGSTFTSWSGACTGTGSCSVTMSASKTVNASFKLNGSDDEDEDEDKDKDKGGGGGGGGSDNPQNPAISTPVVGVCGSASGGLFTSGAALTNTTNRCYYFSSTSTPSTFGDASFWTWTCSGLNGGANSGQCLATKSEVVPEAQSLNCSVIMSDGANANNKTAVNTNTQWKVVGANETELNSGYTRAWRIAEGNGTSTPAGSAVTLNKIFTTIGLKTISVSVASTSGQIFNCSVNNSLATTSVVLPGGLNEI